MIHSKTILASSRFGFGFGFDFGWMDEHIVDAYHSFNVWTWSMIAHVVIDSIFVACIVLVFRIISKSWWWWANENATITTAFIYSLWTFVMCTQLCIAFFERNPGWFRKRIVIIIFIMICITISSKWALNLNRFTDKTSESNQKRKMSCHSKSD